MGTCMLSLKYKFERRIGLYPTTFDPDGVMYSTTAFGDYPCWNADYDIKNPADRFTGWMLLSYEKPVKYPAPTASIPLPILPMKICVRIGLLKPGNRVSG